jgi:hypothetical protein
VQHVGGDVEELVVVERARVPTRHRGAHVRVQAGSRAELRERLGVREARRVAKREHRLGPVDLGLRHHGRVGGCMTTNAVVVVVGEGRARLLEALPGRAVAGGAVEGVDGMAALELGGTRVVVA